VVKAITPNDRRACNKFAVAILEKLDEDKKFLRKIMCVPSFSEGKLTEHLHLGIRMPSCYSAAQYRQFQS
jgi:hypothetical protein